MNAFPAFVVRWITRALDGLAVLLKYESKRLPEHLLTGRRGEDEAYFFLRRAGYVMVARNWRTPGRKGEIDLIGWEGEVLCFIEVKTRTTRDIKPAEAAVDVSKQKELGSMARNYLRRYGRRSGSARRGSGPTVRFDVVSVYYDGSAGLLTDITLFRAAFTMPYY